MTGEQVESYQCLFATSAQLDYLLDRELQVPTINLTTSNWNLSDRLA